MIEKANKAMDVVLGLLIGFAVAIAILMVTS